MKTLFFLIFSAFFSVSLMAAEPTYTSKIVASWTHLHCKTWFIAIYSDNGTPFDTNDDFIYATGGVVKCDTNRYGPDLPDPIEDPIALIQEVYAPSNASLGCLFFTISIEDENTGEQLAAGAIESDC
jgi:hypothetical protein